MGTESLKKKYNTENDVTIKVTLDKVCYYPDEIIKCTINLKLNKFLNDSIFNETSAIIKIIQKQQYVIPGEDDTYVTEEEDILILNKDFITFKGANLLFGINIPLSIEIPKNILTSCYYYKHFIKHFIYFELPGNKAKRTLMIFIRGYKYYTLENKLLKMPANSFGDFYKKKKSKYKGGKISCLLRIPKNSFDYKEVIPFEIYLNCTELNMEISSIKISLFKFVYWNKKNDHSMHYKKDKKIELTWKNYPIDKFLTKYEIKDNINIQYLYHNMSILYESLDLLKEVEIDYKYKDIELLPFCIGGLISVEFDLKVEINYKMKNIKSDILELPIEIYENNSGNNEIIPEISNVKDNQINNKENNSNSTSSQYYNINSINEEDLKNSKVQNLEKPDNFVIYEEEDFDKAFFRKKL